MAQLKLKDKVKDFRNMHNMPGKVLHLSNKVPSAHFKKIHIPKKIHTFDSFKIINYRYLWIAHAIFSSAFWLQQVVIGWTAYQTTKSPLLTSIILGLDVLPILVGAPFGGLITDKFNKKKILGLIYIYQSLLIAVFGIVAIFGVIETWSIFVFVLLMGLGWSIHDPARFSLMSTVVPKEGLINAIALNSMAFSMMQIFIPALAGLLITFIGIGPMLLMESSFLISAALVTQFIKIPTSNEQEKLSLKKALPEIKSGFNFVASNPVIVGFILTTCSMVLFAIAFTNGLMPVYAVDIFKVGPAGLGILLSARGVGSFLSTILLASFGNISRPGVIGFWILSTLSVAMVTMALNNTFLLGLVIIMIISGSSMGYLNISMATVQSLTPNALRGRVIGIFTMSFGMISVGGILSGVLANSFGVQTATFTAGILLLLFAFTGLIIFKRMRDYNTKTY
jgi:MFS family permease